MKRSIVGLVIVLLAVGVLSAQDYKGKGRVTGYVYDEKGAPLAGVRVKLFSVKANEGFELTTDKDGKWTAAWIRSGAWNVDFDKVGYAPKKIFFDISENKKNPDVTITMTKVEGMVITDDVKDMLTKGNELFEQKKYTEALAVYQDILTKYPDAYPIYRNLGNCYFAQEKYDLAEQAYMKVLDKDPKNVEATVAIGNCYTNRGDTAKALEWYGKVDFDKIDDPVVLYNLGTNYFNSAKLEDALKCYQKALDKQKDFLDARYQLGLTYLSLQKNAEAVAVFEEYLKQDPDSARAGQVKTFLDYLKKK
jgi:Flp pilus assembly protein TadD/5-hydroxyisourate hydrolase-like protein (transthyretin family)